MNEPTLTHSSAASAGDGFSAKNLRHMDVAVLSARLAEYLKKMGAPQ